MIDRLGFESGLKIIFTASGALFFLICLLGASTEGYTFIGIIKISSFMSSWMVLLGISVGNVDFDSVAQKRVLQMLQYGSLFLILSISYNYIVLINSIL